MFRVAGRQVKQERILRYIGKLVQRKKQMAHKSEQLNNYLMCRQENYLNSIKSQYKASRVTRVDGKK